jgi:hypothetical protein
MYAWPESGCGKASRLGGKSAGDVITMLRPMKQFGCTRRMSSLCRNVVTTSAPWNAGDANSGCSCNGIGACSHENHFSMT